jgi:hypothetical protein
MSFLSPEAFAQAVALTSGEADAPSTEDTLIPEPLLAETSEGEKEEAPKEETPPPPAEKPASQKFKVKAGEEEKEVELDELLRDYQGRSASTKKFMEAAEIRKEAEAAKAKAEAIIAQVKEREAAVNSLLENPEQIERFYQFKTGKTLGAASQPAQQLPQLPAGLAQMDPNMPVTFGEVQAMLQHQVQQTLAQAKQEGMKPTDVAALKQQLQQEAAQVAQEQALAQYHALEQAKAATSIQVSLETAVKAAVATHPVLAAFDLEELTEKLCDQAQKMDPSSLEEAISHINDLAAARAEKLNATFTATRKEQAVQKAQLEKKGIVAPGIQPISNVAPKASHALGTKEFQREAAEYLQSLMKNR